MSLWNLKRKDVLLVTEPSKIRKRRIYTEEEYDLKCGVAAKKAKVVMDDIEAQLAQLESLDSDTEETKPSKFVDETTFKNQITLQNKVEKMQESDDEEFTGFTKVSLRIFNIFDRELCQDVHKVT